MFERGSKVQGVYYGSAYSGIVTECRPHTIHPTRIEHTVALDAPIEVYGATRNTVIVATHDKNEVCTIERV